MDKGKNEMNDSEMYDDFEKKELEQEIKWSSSDWADWYGVDEEDLEDAFDSDDSLYD